MSLQDLKQQACALSVGDRLELLTAIAHSLREIPSLKPQFDDWIYLVRRPHVWRKQLYIKGRKLLASTVWQDLVVNQMTPAEAAENWDLPLAAIEETIRYCEENKVLIGLEADEERDRLEAQGVSIEPKTAA